MTRRALALGSGGPAAIARETGLLAGLADDGRDDSPLHVHGVLPATTRAWRPIVAA
jgi:hypothetical protein